YFIPFLSHSPPTSALYPLSLHDALPISWCPGITDDLRGTSSPSITCKSVRHTPQARTRTSTSPLPGLGVAASVNSNGFVSIAAGDRKSTRLNSSHVSISYAVFCLKKKI